MYERSTRSFFPEQKCDPVTHMILHSKYNFTTTKSCSVHMTVFEIVVYQLDTNMGMIYLGADNSSIDCRGILTIHSYSKMHDLLRCSLKQLHDMRQYI